MACGCEFGGFRRLMAAGPRLRDAPHRRGELIQRHDPAVAGAQAGARCREVVKQGGVAVGESRRFGGVRQVDPAAAAAYRSI